MSGPHPPEIPEIPIRDAIVVRAALARILSTDLCRHYNLAAVLQKAVDDTLAEQSCRLKASQAARLRALLGEYRVAEGKDDPVRITLLDDGSRLTFTAFGQPSPEEERAVRASHQLWMWISGVAAMLIVLIWSGSWWHARAASAQVRSLAILPLVDESKTGAWFGSGVTETVIDTLAGAKDLHVAARPSPDGDLATIGRKLGVSAVLQGTINRTGKRIQVAVHMDRVADGFRLWTAQFDRPAEDVSNVPRLVATAIADRVQVNMAAKVVPRHRPIAGAYAAYLQGRGLFDPSKPANFDQAAAHLEEATRLDPEFALAWAWLSIVREYGVAAGLARPNQAMPESRDAAERSVALDPDCGDGHLALGIVNLQYDWDWADAKEEFDRAIQSSPGSALALEWRAHWYETQGRLDEAMAEMQRAQTLDPLSSALADNLAEEYVAIRQTDRALPLAEKAVELAPGYPRAQVVLARVQALAGKLSIADLRNSAAKLPIPVVATLAAELGEKEDARQILDQAEDIPDDALLPVMTYVRLAAALQDWERCFAWAQEASGGRDVELPYLRMNPSIPKTDSRFADYLAYMNLPSAPIK